MNSEMYAERWKKLKKIKSDHKVDLVTEQFIVCMDDDKDADVDDDDVGGDVIKEAAGISSASVYRPTGKIQDVAMCVANHFGEPPDFFQFFYCNMN